MAVTDELLKLDVRPRLKLIDEIWDSILRADAGSSWADARSRLLTRR